MSDEGLSREEVLEALKAIRDPDLGRDIVSLGFVTLEDVALCGDRVKVTITLTTPACPVRDEMRRQAEEILRSLPGIAHAEVEMRAQVRSTGFRGPRPVEGVRNLIAVASNKGGVGKSTVAVNLALALRDFGARVGLLDADLTGPNVPTMLGLPPGFQADRGLSIVERYGIKVVSLGFLLPPGTAVIWRGPMIGTGVRQLLHDIPWGEDGELDYLVVDLPPGTSDASMSLAQDATVTGVVIVTTPNLVSIEDALKAVSLFERLHVPIFGVIENMSYFICPHCEGRVEIFGHGRVQEVCREAGLDYLGAIPLDPRVREGADRGVPIVEADPHSPVAQAIRAIAQKVAAKASIQHFAVQASSGERG
jgi:ATP-binding protein involved in chromosome partitioning